MKKYAGVLSQNQDADNETYSSYSPQPTFISTAESDFEDSEPESTTTNAVLETTDSIEEELPPAEVPAETQRVPEKVLIGLDLGTNTTCIQIAEPGANSIEISELIPSIVGYAREGILPGVIPGDKKILFGQEALDHRLHLDLVHPLKDGIIDNQEAVRDFLFFIKERIGESIDTEYRAVIGMPANASPTARENIRHAVTGIFDKVILIPEPFLAALGSRSSQTSSQDPLRNSLFVDIGAGSTDVCLIQGYFPSSEDQISLAFAGDAVDRSIQRSLLESYPDCAISLYKCRELKEQYSFVNGIKNSVLAPVMVNGKLKRIDVAEAINAACNELLERVHSAVRSLIIKADPDSIPELLQNIIVTGGGCMISGFDQALEALLNEEGFENCKVTSVGESYKMRVASGALMAANQAEERQWQNILR